MSREKIDIAVRQIEFARQYTQGMIEEVRDDEWFRQVGECPTHLAWQVGHLAMAQYGLTMLRIRGKEPEDEEIVSKSFLRAFKKGSQPVFDASQYPPIGEILSTFNRVHKQSLEELSKYNDDDLTEKLPMPHAVFETKLGSIFFCSVHEMLHNGQIGLLRRMLGKDPIR